MKHQTIVTETGEELVVLTRRQYDALLAAAGDEAAEDRMTALIAAERGGEPSVPSWLAEAVIAGATPVKAARQRAGLTQAALAAAAGITQGYLSDLERGAKAGSDAVLARIAAATGIETAWLTAWD
jgi:DNA-binding XRE family transcriptional regulator